MDRFFMQCIYMPCMLCYFLVLNGCGSSDSATSVTTSTVTVADNTSTTTCFDITIAYTGSSKTSPLCVTNENNGINGLGVYRFIRFSLVSSQSVTVTVNRTSGLNPADPDIQILSKGNRIALSQSFASNIETLITSLNAGDYIIQIYDDNYVADNLKLNVVRNKQLDATSTITDDQPKPIQTLASGCTSASNIILGGKVTYDRIPHKTNNALDYNNISAQPVRLAVVELICEGSVLLTTNTDVNGDYSFTAPSNISNVFIRVKAKMLATSPATYDFSVVDNTQSQSLYVMDGTAFNIFAVDINNENLHAASGWSAVNSAYSSTRVAAPFAILDSVYLSMKAIVDIDSTISFPALRINWSVNNTTSSGSNAAGQIGTSHYNGVDIYILGAENNDTDEFDDHVIIHEWGHYFEDKFSRSDSIGGPHSTGDIIDIRLAFGEGFGNAYSAIASGNPIYRDSLGLQQASGFGIDIDNNNCLNAGWYSECSVQSIIYDIFDSSDDGSDSLSLGLLPIYNILTGNHKNTESLTSIFSFIKYLKDAESANSSVIDALISAQNIDVITDIYGDSELTNNPGTLDQLPIFTSM